MTIKEQKINGDAFYGWAGAWCSTCPSKFGNVILKEEGRGEYDNVELAPARIELVRKAAEGHNKNTGGDHSIIFNIYSK